MNESLGNNLLIVALPFLFLAFDTKFSSDIVKDDGRTNAPGLLKGLKRFFAQLIA